MTIEWNDNLATGVNEIDAQHKELFKRINVLFEACSKRKGKAEVNNLMKFLGEYVVLHFDTEEKYMTMFNYPEYSSHKEEHTNFIRDFLYLKNQFETGNENLTLLKLNMKLVDWLRQHIGNVDQKLGVFLTHSSWDNELNIEDLRELNDIEPYKSYTYLNQPSESSEILNYLLLSESLDDFVSKTGLTKESAIIVLEKIKYKSINLLKEE